jgi:hypothetical protein
LFKNEDATMRYHAVQRAVRGLDQIRSLIVRIDAQAINSVAYFVDLDKTATADTLPMAAGIYHQHQADSWVRIFAVDGIKPTLHDRDGAAVVSQRAATLISEQPKPRKLAGQW